MTTPNVRAFQKQVGIDFAAYQARECCSAEKALQKLNTESKKSPERTILHLGQLRQLISKHIVIADVIRLQIFAKTLTQQLALKAA
ncbi:hypothetical protein [Oleiharenicola lentus]|uniref:hypothetical protein n=1 Tax=Oleiharenicola lentus TaxID=2508720 RepID=UPI003F679F1B